MLHEVAPRTLGGGTRDSAASAGLVCERRRHDQLADPWPTEVPDVAAIPLPRH